jgi:CheY-like chemotaxis protein
MNRKVILVIDDDPAFIFTAEKAIAKTWPDSVVKHAEEGDEAIELIRREKKPDLILLDYQMPGKNGIDILKEIRKNEKTRYVPVVMHTASSRASDVKAAYDAGANSYLNKNLDFISFTEELSAVLHYWLEVNRSVADAC